MGPPASLGPWTLDSYLGSGAFGSVHTAHRAGEPPSKWVLKVAPYIPPSGKKHNAGSTGGRLLYWEHTLYTNFVKNHPQFPLRPAETKDVYGEEAGWRYLALEKFTLGTLSEYRGARSLELTATVGLKLLSALETLHSRGILYRDLKPENIMMDEARWVVLVDFGACIKYMLHSGKPMDAGQGEAGTPRFMARHVHSGAPPAARDDVESLLYLLVWMQTRALPWDEAGSAAQVAALKQTCSAEDLCADEEARPLLPLAKFVLGLSPASVPYATIRSLLIKLGALETPPHLPKSASSSGGKGGKRRPSTDSVVEKKRVRPKSAAPKGPADKSATAKSPPEARKAPSSPARRASSSPPARPATRSSSSRLALALLLGATTSAVLATAAAKLH